MLACYVFLKKPHRWEPPAPEIRYLAALLRRRDVLLGDALREENRLEKYLSTDTPADIISSCRRMAQLLREEVSNIERQIKASPALRRDYTLLTSIKSVGPRLGMHMLACFAGITLRQLSRLPPYWARCRSRNAQAHRSGADRGCRKSPPVTLFKPLIMGC